MRNSIKTFGLALMAACSLMALFAVAAQAEDLTDGGSPGYFLVLELKSLVAGAEFTGTSLHGILLIEAKNAYVLCPKGKIKGKGLNENEVLAEVTFEECKAFNDKTKAALGACPVEGEPSKETITATTIALARLHGGELFILFHPDAKEEFAIIKFGPECGIGVKVKILGLLAALVDNGLEDLKEHLLLFSQAIQKLLGVKLFYGASEAFITGANEGEAATAHVTLTGKHLGCTWAVH